MSSHHHLSDHDPVADTADHPPPPPARWQHDDTSSASSGLHIRLMCSFGGRILPRPHDNQLRYVGGDTRIVALPRSSSSFSGLLSKLSKLTPTADVTIKYQLPNEDLDALISVTSDEDLDNMIEEYDRLLLSRANATATATPPRLRLFLFPSSDDTTTAAAAGFGSILSGTGSSKHERWFLDALNGGGRSLERGRSEASSIVSEVPDYLFGLENNSDEPVKQKTSVSISDPGSPSLTISSPHYGSASSAPSGAAAATVEIKPDEPEVNRYVPQPVWQYVPEPAPFYYVPGPVQGGSLPVRPFAVPVPYIQPVQQQVGRGQIPVGYRPVYVGAGGPGTYDYQVGPTTVRTGALPMYRPTMGVPPATGEAPRMGGAGRGSNDG